ncbi:MAG: hypothetical protein R3C46_08360 [Hyphomonadaceae bacterium]
MAIRWNYGGTVRLKGELRNEQDYMILCLACGHRAVIRKEAVLEIWWEGTRIRDIARALRCWSCKAELSTELHMTHYRVGHTATAQQPWGPFQGYHEVTTQWVIDTLGQAAWEDRNARWNSYRLYRDG